MMKKMLLAGALFVVGCSQAITLRFNYKDTEVSCGLSEHNKASVQFENGLTIKVLNAEEQADGSVIANIAIELNGQEHSAPTVLIPVAESVVITCESPEFNESLTITLEESVAK